MTSIYFVTGLHRSGTTVISEAIADAVGGSMITVSDLAKHIPHLDDLVSNSDVSGTTPNQNGNGSEISQSTPAEYGWYLYSVSGQRYFGFKRKFRSQLSDLMNEVMRRAGSEGIVMKNPWDTANEATLLSEFTDARSIIIRRSLQALEASSLQIMRHPALEGMREGAPTRDERDTSPTRNYESEEYMGALMNNDSLFHGVSRALHSPAARWLLVVLSKWGRRLAILLLIRRIRKLPLDRVGFISYDEMCKDPARGAQWLGHILDPAAFAQSFEGLISPTAQRPSAQCSAVVRALDRYWERAWSDMRRQQIRAGVLAHDCGRRTISPTSS